MADRSRLARFVRIRARQAGQTYERARQAYHEGRTDVVGDEYEHRRIVCRRHAERRTVTVDTGGRPDCFDPDHLDCAGCREDILADRVETWSPREA